MKICPLCSLETKEYRALFSSHYNSKHKDIQFDDYKLLVLKHNNDVLHCKTCQKPIITEINRKRKYCSRECYSPKGSSVKKCKVCKQDKVLDNFYRSSRNTLSVESTCISCKKKPKKIRVKAPKSAISILKNRARSLLAHQLKENGYNKGGRTHELIGIEFEGLKVYLEKQFQPGMTWDNYSRNGWTIDHICPVNQAVNVEEFNKLQYYTNCRPMWHKDNIVKNDRYTVESEQKCIELLGREWIGFKDNNCSKKKLILVTGASGAGKSWVLSNLHTDRYLLVDSDKEPRKNLVLRCWQSSIAPILTLTSSVSTFIRNQGHRFDIDLIVIQDSVETIEANLIKRGGSITPSIKARIKRMNTLAKSAIFSGTSSEVLEYIRSLK